MWLINSPVCLFTVLSLQVNQDVTGNAQWHLQRVPCLPLQNCRSPTLLLQAAQVQGHGSGHAWHYLLHYFPVKLSPYSFRLLWEKRRRTWSLIYSYTGTLIMRTHGRCVSQWGLRSPWVLRLGLMYVQNIFLEESTQNKMTDFCAYFAFYVKSSSQIIILGLRIRSLWQLPWFINL